MAKFTWFQLGCIITLAFCGTFGSLLMKWITLQYSVGALDEYHKFSHPFFLNWLMFVSESICGLMFLGFFYYYKWEGEGREETSKATKGDRNFSPLILVPPCVMDLIASAFAMVGLHLTYISSLLMFRASQVIFTGALSAVFLNRRFKASELFGMLLVFLGLVFIGMTDFYYTKEDKDIPPIFVVVGDLCMIASCAIGSCFVVYQQKVYFTNADLPVLLAVGIEGIYGLVLMTLINIGFYFWDVGSHYGKNPRHVAEDCIDAVIQIWNNNWLLASMPAKILLTTFYNYAQMSIIKELSALTRQIVDNIKIITVWIISVTFLDESVVWQKIPGFIILMYGMFLYNGITMMGTIRKQITN